MHHFVIVGLLAVVHVQKPTTCEVLDDRPTTARIPCAPAARPAPSSSSAPPTRTARSIDPIPTQEEEQTMSKPTTTTIRIVATAVLGGGMIAALGGFAAAPALAAEQATPADPKTSAAASPITGSVSLDPVAIVNAINVAVNDQRDRNGAVQAALDVGYYNAGNPDRLTVAVVNKNQDIYVEGAIVNGPGKVTNNGDGGFLNWGVLGNSVKNGNVISVNGG
jgi:hypothetical protein